MPIKIRNAINIKLPNIQKDTVVALNNIAIGEKETIAA